jgi:undecaprenyl pyrophosphate synthase
LKLVVGFGYGKAEELKYKAVQMCRNLQDGRVQVENIVEKQIFVF